MLPSPRNSTAGLAPSTFATQRNDDTAPSAAPSLPSGNGNPFARHATGLRQALCERVTPVDIQAVADQLVDQARLGNLAAIRLLFSYVLGQPGRMVDPDSLDREEKPLSHHDPLKSGQPEAPLGSLCGAGSR